MKWFEFKWESRHLKVVQFIFELFLFFNHFQFFKDTEENQLHPVYPKRKIRPTNLGNKTPDG